MEPALLMCPECGTPSDDGADACGACGAPTTADADKSRAIRTNEVFGSYRVLSQIGEGGMGRIFVAEHTRLGRRVALKMLRSELAGNIEAVKRFFAEARAVNRIKHENIIEVSDFIENDQGRSYYIMELLTGEDLRTLEDRAGALPLGRALDIAIQVCRGLGAAHGAGIVHRDLKPDNIFLTARPDGRDLVKLLDFGVAKLLSPSQLDVSTFKTNAGIVVGTPLYMSPEQAAGKPVDHRTDIYALGVILFEMVTGQRPFQADSFGELLVQHMTLPPPRPSRLRNLHQAVPRVLERLILSCMEKEPADRPQQMSEVDRSLREIALALGASAETLAPPPKRRGLVGRLSLAVGAAALIGALAFGARHRGAHLLAAFTRRASPPIAVPTSPPPAMPASAPQKHVEIAFDSDPPGASIFIDGALTPVGVTPFSSTFDASPRKATFEFRAEGRSSARREVSLERDAHIEVVLAPVVAPLPAARTHGHGKRSALDHDAVFNPFE